MSEAARWQEQCLEALKAMGKALGQMSLYRVGHPEVAQTLKVAFAALEEAHREIGGGEISFSINQGKIIANGRLIGAVSRVPNAIPVFFERLKIGSLTFKPGLRMDEMEAFCELSAFRRDALGASTPKDYLKAKGVEHIVLDEAVYARVSAEPENQGRAAAGESLDGAMRALIERAVSDPGEREKIRETVARLLEEDVRRRVEGVVKPWREAKTRLENEQARTEGVLHRAVDGVIVVDERGKILMMNPVAEQVWGTSLAQAAGLSLVDKSGENQVVTLAAELTAPADRAIDAKALVAAPPDLLRSVQSSGAVVQTEEGKIVGMVAGPTDAAKYREMERLQREFVAHVTHELRSPLSSIRAALEILQGESAPKLDAEHGRMIDSALRNSDRLADLIGSILDFSKIEAGQMEVHLKKEDAGALVREAAGSLEPWIRKKGLRFSCEVEPNLPPIRADGARTVQVLLNLISNAIKFTPAGGAVALRAGVDPEDGRRLRFCVSDTGPGIAKDQQDRIFEKFVQIAAGEFHPGGTGLGLSIAKALVHMQQGRLWLESDQGQGAAFFFTLPVFSVQDLDATQTTGPTARAWWKRLLGL